MVSQSDKADWNTLLKNATHYTRKSVLDLYQLKQEPFYEADVSETQTIVSSTDARTTDINANQQQYEFFMAEGVAFYKVRKLEQAILSFRSALKYKPNDQQAYNNIAVCQADLGIVAFTQADYANFYRILSKLESQADFKLPMYAYSQYTLGIMYLKGKGCKKDHEKAQYWLTISASNGVKGACRVLNRLGIDDCN
jgi:TPR repeat protein